jgi:hypothetical protein
MGEKESRCTKQSQTGFAQPFLLTLPDLDEELEDREEEELDRPAEEARPEEDPPDLATLEERPEEEPPDLGALMLRPEEPLEREGAEDELRGCE